MNEHRRVLFISSSGGHWVQLRRLRPAFEGWARSYACTNAAYDSTVDPEERFFSVPEASRWSKWRLVRQALAVLWIVVRTRPEVVVSTGASPGFFAMFFGFLFGKKTIWIDSIANVDEMSLSGRQARYFAKLWVTQWPHLAGRDGPRYFGSLV